MSRRERPRVYVITPLGRGGWGGIDRLMDDVRQQLAISDRQDVVVRFLTSRGNGHLAWSIPRMVGCTLRLALAKFTGRVDLVHINLSVRGSARRKILLGKAIRALGIPYAVHLHGPEFGEYWDREAPWVARGLKELFSRAASTIVLGEVWADVVGERAPEARIRILRNGSRSPAEPARGDPAQPTILFMGQLGGRKGVPTLVEALGLLADLPAWKAILAGDGPLEPVRAGLAERGVQERVALPGWLGPETVAQLMSTGDILTLPSRQENLPMSVIEAMAYGLATVATPVGATPEIVVDEVTGLLIPPDNAAELSQALRRLLVDRDQRDRLGRAARDYHRSNLELSGYVDQLVSIWKEAVVRISSRSNRTAS